MCDHERDAGATPDFGLFLWPLRLVLRRSWQHDKLGMDQHLQAAARRSHRETAGYIKNCISIWAVTRAREAAFEATRR